MRNTRTPWLRYISRGLKLGNINTWKLQNTSPVCLEPSRTWKDMDGVSQVLRSELLVYLFGRMAQQHARIVALRTNH